MWARIANGSEHRITTTGLPIVAIVATHANYSNRITNRSIRATTHNRIATGRYNRYSRRINI